jgi:hypothetical protein
VPLIEFFSVCSDKKGKLFYKIQKNCFKTIWSFLAKIHKKKTENKREKE